MKRIVIAIALLAMRMLIYSQGGTATNTRGGGTFLGYNTGVAGPLDIRNDFNNSIIFRTNGAPLERMRISQTASVSSKQFFRVNPD